MDMRKSHLLQTVDELITALRREVLIVEEVLRPVSVLVGAILVLVGDTAHDRVLDAVELLLETRLACLSVALVLDGLVDGGTLADVLSVALGFNLHMMTSEPARCRSSGILTCA